MKRWQVILLCAVCAAVLLVVGGIFTYRTIVIPKYIEPVLAQVAQAVNDEKIQKEMVSYIEELEDEGLLDNRIVSKYIARYSVPELGEDEIEEIISANTENSSYKANVQSDPASQAQAQLGISTVKVKDSGEDTEKQYTYSAKAEENAQRSAAMAVKQAEQKMNKEDNEDYSEKSKTSGKKTKDEKGEAEAKTSGNKTESDKTTSKTTGTSLYERAKKAMTSSDLSTVYDLATKVDISYIKSIYSNKKELKSYLSAVLTKEEISKAMELYLKYAYLLQD